MDIQQRANAVRIVGTIDAQRIGRREETTITQSWNGVQGIDHRMMVQVRSPFGTPFQLPLSFDRLEQGQELLAESLAGTPLCAEGTIEWLQREDSRYATDLTTRGRRITETIVRVKRVLPITPEDEPGCDVWLEGSGRRSVRRYLHPDRRVPIAVVSLDVLVERTRRLSMARLVEQVEVQVAIPVDHPDLPNLMRLGNRVAVEGMLERIVVPLRNDDPQVQAAVTALDQRWQAQTGQQPPNRDEQRRYSRQRQRLQQTIVTRVVAGYVGLLAGTPATLEEATALRTERQRQRDVDRQERAEANEHSEHPDLPLLEPRRPRRRATSEETHPTADRELESASEVTPQADPTEDQPPDTGLSNQ